MTDDERVEYLRELQDRDLRRVNDRLRGFILGCISTSALMLMLFFSVLVYPQEIPHVANAHKRELIRASRSVWGMDAPTATFAAQVHQESLWRAQARSHVGALGLTQFMPATAQWIASAYPADLHPPSPHDPSWSLRALAQYNRFLFERVDGIDECERMAFTLAAYNGGLGWVYKRKAKSPTPTICLGATCNINPGIKPSNQVENANYPHRILLKLEPLYESAGWGRGVCA